MERAKEDMLAIVVDSRNGSDFAGGLACEDPRGIYRFCRSIQIPMPIQEERALL